MGHIHFWGKHKHAYRVVIHESYIPTEGKKEKDTFDTVTRYVLNEYRVRKGKTCKVICLLFYIIHTFWP